ncbi:hypothetical protein CEXT_211001 [Caerostris extrusa]|uniref:Uncharacterized protein n=1 Tax=Caerostris extrusa TaxID=172846 RepID=A0AAV4M5X7_CAEEX|nr:hypothetical protein CEXT_211001 [Caerostris extrusa]
MKERRTERGEGRKERKTEKKEGKKERRNEGRKERITEGPNEGKKEIKNRRTERRKVGKKDRKKETYSYFWPLLRQKVLLQNIAANLDFRRDGLRTHRFLLNLSNENHNEVYEPLFFNGKSHCVNDEKSFSKYYAAFIRLSHKKHCKQIASAWLPY